MCTLLKKAKRERIKISGFLDNNASRSNHNVKSVFEHGYNVQNLNEKLKEDSTFNSVYVICHWQEIIDIISEQLLESGIKREAIVKINW